MLNRYSLIFYILAFVFLTLDKNIISFTVLILAGFFVAYIYHLGSSDEIEEINTAYTFNEIKLFENKNELLNAFKNKNNAEVLEASGKEKQITIDIQKTMIFLICYFFTLLFLYFTFKNSLYLIAMILAPFLILSKKEE